MRDLVFITFRDLAKYLKSEGKFLLPIPAEQYFDGSRDTNRQTSRNMSRNRQVGYNYG